MDKKMFFYEVDPLFFYDSNNDGFGDFEGLDQKINYFQYLNIDAILLPDIFNQEDNFYYQFVIFNPGYLK